MSEPPPSAWELARTLGHSLPAPESLPAESFELVEAVRSLVAAVVTTDADPAVRAAVAASVEGLAATLGETARAAPVVLTRHADGRVENLTQAGSGRLNPQAAPLVFDPPELPDRAAGPVPVEVVGRCRLNAAHGGPPERAHGGVVVTMLDEAIGLAVTAAGVSGMTAQIAVSFRAPTPLHEELEVRARWSHSEGRRHHGTGEVLLGDGTVLAQAEGLFVSAAG